MSRVLKVAVVVLSILILQGTLTSSIVSPYISRIVVLCCFSVMLAVSLNIINGYAGQFSIGHAGFYAVGAYSSGAVSVYVTSRWFSGLSPEWLASSLILMVSVIVGAVTAAIAGLLVGIPSLRLKGDYLAIATLGFGEMIRVVILNIPAVGGALGFNDIPIIAPFFWIALFTVIIVWLCRNLLQSKVGRALQAIRDDETAAGVLGINVTQFKVTAFVLSAAMAGCAGALYAHYDGYLQPESFNFIRSIEIIIMVVIGGLGSTTGAVIAATILTILPESLRDLQSYRMVIYSALLVLVMLVRPQGLLGTGEWGWGTIRRRRRSHRAVS